MDQSDDFVFRNRLFLVFFCNETIVYSPVAYSSLKITKFLEAPKLKMRYRRWLNCPTLIAILLPSLLLGGFTTNAEMTPFSFCPVYFSKGTQFCASGSPALNLTSVSITQCALECVTNRTTQCVSFNYNQTASRCEIHDHQPTKFVASNSCTNYQVREIEFWSDTNYTTFLIILVSK